MTRTFALIFGIVFLLVGILGFVPSLVTPTSEHGMQHGILLGLFPINAAHNAVHILFGLWGLLASRSLGGARGYFQGVGIIYLLLTLLGLFDATNTTFGMVPIYGNDVYLHGVLALLGLLFGFAVKERDVVVR